MAFDILQRKGSCLKYKPFYRQIHIVTSNVAISTALSREKNLFWHWEAHSLHSPLCPRSAPKVLTGA
jgi:hypothetical protein